MRRRTLMAGLGAVTLARPSLVRAAADTTLRFIPQIDLAFLDPHWSTANITRNHGQMVFDTLYGCGTDYRATPQMLEGHETSTEGRQWRLTLRPGLRWHDNEPVLARDCVASIRRWAKRDAFGGALMRATDDLSAPDDRTIVFRLNKPFPLLPDALGKPGAYMPAMMPERLAATDPGKQVTEMVGSGPFRFLADQRVPGSRNVYARFEGYKPREGGAADWCSGPKVVHYDRVVWTTIPDAATAAAALQAGEQDWWEQATPDLQAMLRQDKAITVEVLDPSGTIGMMRPNHLQQPFNNPAIRRALLMALDQTAEVQSVVGDNPSQYTVPCGVFTPGTPMASDAGLGVLTGRRDFAAATKALREAGYAGEPVLLVVPTDYQHMQLMGEVLADTMRRAGMTVNYVATDWATMLQRRLNKGTLDKGGWGGFITSWTGSDWLNPASHISLHGNGEAGYPGWSTSLRTEELIGQWFDATDLGARQAICRDIQVQSMQDVPFYPLGRFAQETAYRGITGVLKGFSVFWNVKPA
ncbi:MAG: ABC transporter substrate-binding protein [Janthinobacterium lividum]